MAIGEQEGGSDAEVAVGGIGVVRGGDGALLEICGQGGVERAGWHETEAIGCEGGRASRVALMVKVLHPIKGMWTT